MAEMRGELKRKRERQRKEKGKHRPPQFIIVHNTLSFFTIKKGMLDPR
jgi:hypothetical protein